MEILIKTAQLFLSLSILVIIHELGHFIFAKLFKTRVEKFYLFFNPWFSVFKFQYKETEYGVGWLPLGGYVKISGMIDESMDKEQMKQDPQPWEFRSKPAWQRLLVMIGGVLFNFILAFMIYSMILYTWGEKYLPTQNMTYGIVTDTLAREIGLKDGDKIITIDQHEVVNFADVMPELLLGDEHSLQIDRNGEKLNIVLTEKHIAGILKRDGFFIEPAYPFFIQDFAPGSAAKEAGIEVGDQIISLNGQYLPFFRNYTQTLKQYADEMIELKVLRLGDTVTVRTQVSSAGMLGVMAKSPFDLMTLQTREFGFWESLPAGIVRGWKKMGDYIRQFKLLFNPETEAYKSVGGFIAIGNIFPSFWDWQSFWSMTALLSIMLGVVNILPIPALDGGHVLFLLYEIIANRKPSDKFLEYAQIVGMVLLLALLLFANGNDIIKLFQ